MYQKALALNEVLGRKEGMATNYGNLGNIYNARGELDKAEAMYQKALSLDEALGSKEGMAADYNALGIVYFTREQVDRQRACIKMPWHFKSLWAIRKVWPITMTNWVIRIMLGVMKLMLRQCI